MKYEAKVSSRVSSGERGVVILASCLLRPMRRNSVLEEFSVRRFAVIQKFDLEHCEGDLCWSRSESEGRIERAECHLHRWFREQEEIRMLRGVVYMTKSSGPRTEPWGTPQEDVCQEDRSVTHLTRKGRDDRYDLNQLRTEPWMPNQDERRVIKMSWSIVSKAAERCREVIFSVILLH